jgi:hypothetical protein
VISTRAALQKLLQLCNGRPRLGHGCALFACHPSIKQTLWRKAAESADGAGLGAMDQLIERLVAGIGVDRAAAEQAGAIILSFTREEAGAAVRRQTVAAIPGRSRFI